MVSLHGEIDPTSDRMYAFSVVGPMCTIEQMNAEVKSVFALAEKYNIPLFFQMDDCTNYSQDFGTVQLPTKTAVSFITIQKCANG